MQVDSTDAGYIVENTVKKIKERNRPGKTICTPQGRSIKEDIQTTDSFRPKIKFIE